MRAAYTPLLAELERAKRLFVQERFLAARRSFETLVRASHTDAPDVWIDARYGVGECLRLRHDFEEASRAYREVIQRVTFGGIVEGRLAASNRVSGQGSFLGLVQIGRASLRFETALLTQLLADGEAWAVRTFGPGGSTAFALERALLKLNVEGAEAAVRDLEALLPETEATRAEPGRPEANVAWVRLQEARLEAGEKADLGTFVPVEASRGWSEAMLALLRARAAIASGRLRVAVRHLEGPAAAEDVLATYPELRLRLAVLRLLACMAPGGDGRALEQDRRRLADSLQIGAERAADMSTPLWGTVLLLRWRLERGAEAEAACPLRALAATLARAFDSPWLRAALESRSVGESEASLLRDALDRAQWGEEAAPLAALLARVETAAHP